MDDGAFGFLCGSMFGFGAGCLLILLLINSFDGEAEQETIRPEPGIVCVVYGSKIDCMREENQDDK
jgi:hypothetical protein